MRRIATSLTALALLAAACGGATQDAGPAIDGMDPQAMLQAASSRAESAGSARVQMTVTYGVEGQPVTMSVDGAQDLRNGRAHMTMDMDELMELIGGQGLPPGADANMEMIIDDQIMYMRGGLLSATMGIDGWISIDLDAAAQGSGMDLSAMMGSQPQDFGAYLDMLQGVSADIQELGREDVRGVTTTHLRATVDQGVAYAALDAESRAALEDMMDQGGFPEQYPMDVWVGDDGLVRRVRVELTDLATGPESMTMVMEYFDFGVEVDVTPPADAVDLEELMSGTNG